MYSEEELREFEQQLANEANDINMKSVELQKQREELEKKQEELNAQKFGLQQVNSQILYIKYSQVEDNQESGFPPSIFLCSHF